MIASDGVSPSPTEFQMFPIMQFHLAVHPLLSYGLYVSSSGIVLEVIPDKKKIPNTQNLYHYSNPFFPIREMSLLRPQWISLSGETVFTNKKK